jgi:signal transduction histidine kinase
MSAISPEQTRTFCAVYLCADPKTIDALRSSRRFVRSLDILRDNIDVTTTAGERITSIVRTLRNFARLDEAEYQVTRVEEGIESTIALMRHQIPEEIQVVTSFGDTPPIFCSPGELNQVFMNLIRNAFSAIQDRGRVEIRTVHEGDQLRISITDDGVGIPKERLARIFELGFSSTRDRVKMGTGLATAFRVVNEHDGVINIESEVGKGTTVVIQLPVRKS